MPTLTGRIVVLLGVCALPHVALGQGPRGVDGLQDRLRRLDRNGDGKIERSEVPPFLRSRMADIAKQGGLNPDEPIEISKLSAAMMARGRGPSREKDQGEKTQPAGSSKQSASDSLVPGFGEELDLPLVPGFGEDAIVNSQPLEQRYSERVMHQVNRTMRYYDRNRDDILDAEEMKRVQWGSPPPSQSDLNGDGQLTKAEMCERIAKRYNEDSKSSSTKSSSTPSSGSSRDAKAASERVQRYAQSLMRQYDQNGNRVLEENEWRRMRGNMQDADKDGDKRITLAELNARLANYGRGSSWSRSRSSWRDSSSSKSSTQTGGKSDAERKSYRFASPTERLPKNLPDWFVRNDRNGDGQIAMAEFSTSWTSSKLAEFKKFDRNNDGLITPRECAAVSEK